MSTMRIALVFVVVAVATLLSLWALGLVGAGQVLGATGRTFCLVAVVAVATGLVLRLLSRQDGSGDGGAARQGPNF